MPDQPAPWRITRNRATGRWYAIHYRCAITWGNAWWTNHATSTDARRAAALHHADHARADQ